MGFNDDRLPYTKYGAEIKPKPDGIEGLLTIDEEISLRQKWHGLNPDTRPSWRNYWLKAQLVKDQKHEQDRVKRIKKEIEEYFKKTGYSSEKEYNWWQEFWKKEGIK